MPLNHGVAENFIGILRHEERMSLRKAVRTLALFGLVALLTGLAVDLPEGRFFGVGFGLVSLVFLGGGILGITFGRLVTAKRYRDSLSTNWNRWMRYSIACDRVDEVHRKVRGRSANRSVGGLATLWAIVLFTTVVLLLMTVVDGVPAVDKTPVFLGYGAYLGFVFGRTLAIRTWVHQFLISLDEMVRAGELGVWGVV